MDSIDPSNFGLESPDNPGWSLPTNSAYMPTVWQPQVDAYGTTTLLANEHLNEPRETSFMMLPTGNTASSALPVAPAQNSLATTGKLEPGGHVRQGPIGAEFEKHRAVIEYHHPRMTLKELKALMAGEHKFTASDQQWKRQLSAWELGKNIPHRVSAYIVKKHHRRRTKEKKRTYFNYRGKPVPETKVKRYIQTQPDNPSSPTGTVPSDLTFGTCRSLGETSSIPMCDTTGERQAEPATRPIRPEFLYGQDVDKYLEIQSSAVDLAHRGDYPRAKVAFMEALEGLECLLGATHSVSLDVLANFVTAAVNAEDFDEAIQRLRKSYTDHQEALGDNNKKTWQSYAQLGIVYRAQKKIGQALKHFLDARQGLQAITTMDLEESFNFINPITDLIVGVYVEVGDLEDAEAERRDQISQAETLGAAYRMQVADYKHELVHFYVNKDYQQRIMLGHVSHSPPKQRVEQLLVEALETYGPTCSGTSAHLCSLEQLRKLYESTGQIEKLRPLLRNIELALSTLQPTEFLVFQRSLDLMKGIARSFSRFCEWGLAEWWLLYRQQQIERSRALGPNCHESLSNNMQLAKLQFDQAKPQAAEPFLKKARQIATDLLPPNHHLHGFIAQILADGAWAPYNFCKSCLVNLPNPARRAILGGLVTSDTEISGESDSEEGSGSDTDLNVAEESGSDTDTDLAEGGTLQE